MIKDSGSKGFDPGLIVLLVVVGLLLVFLVGNHALLCTYVSCYYSNR